MFNSTQNNSSSTTQTDDADLAEMLAQAQKEAEAAEAIENESIANNANDEIECTEPYSNLIDENQNTTETIDIADTKTIRDAELETAQSQALRAMADLQNFKKRAENEKRDYIKYASTDLLIKLLPVLDNFERAFSSLPEDLKNHDWIKGVSQIEKTFVTILDKEGLEIISPNHDDEFNTKFHECVMADINTEESKVGQCLEKGYQFKGKVLRVAKVSVGNKVN